MIVMGGGDVKTDEKKPRFSGEAIVFSVILFLMPVLVGCMLLFLDDKESRSIPAEVSKWPNTGLDESGEFVRMVRERGPSTYSIIIESVTTLQDKLVSTDNSKNGGLELNHFSAGNYTWALQLYPNGTENGTDGDYLSFNLKLISDIKGSEVVVVMFNFFIYDQVRDNYFIIQGLKERRFHAAKREWGISKVISLSDFKDPLKGFVKDDSCVIGVDIVYIDTNNAEAAILTLPENYTSISQGYRFTWVIPQFSKLKLPRDNSPEFLGRDGVSWKFSIYPNDERDGLSLFLQLSEDQKWLKIGDKLLVDAVFVIKDQTVSYDQKESLRNWFKPKQAWGFANFISSNSLKRFMKNDRMVIQVDINVRAIIKAI